MPRIYSNPALEQCFQYPPHCKMIAPCFLCSDIRLLLMPLGDAVSRDNQTVMMSWAAHLLYLPYIPQQLDWGSAHQVGALQVAPAPGSNIDSELTTQETAVPDQVCMFHSMVFLLWQAAGYPFIICVEQVTLGNVCSLNVLMLYCPWSLL